MKILQFFKYFAVDPVNFSLKAKILSLLACFCSIFFIVLITKIISPWANHPLIVASMGASAIILFFIPNSPLAQPWPFIGGQLVSAIVGVFCAINISNPLTAEATAVGGAVLLMLLLRCLHPPGAATALTPVMAGQAVSDLGYSFVIIPVAINIISMLLLAIIINRWVLKRSYPSPLPIKKRHRQRHVISMPSHQMGFVEEDIDLALKQSDVFIDMTRAELGHLLMRVKKNGFQRLTGEISCADIMITEIITLEYGTEVEDAWQLMNEHKLKVMPVIDKANRIIGILTWNDFFKGIDLSVRGDIQAKFQQFIRRTPDVNSSKPESVGFIMTPTVITASESMHIVELIKLMSIEGHRQIPIINAEKRLVGMVYQANLIAALYNQQLATDN